LIFCSGAVLMVVSFNSTVVLQSARRCFLSVYLLLRFA